MGCIAGFSTFVPGFSLAHSSDSTARGEFWFPDIVERDDLEQVNCGTAVFVILVSLWGNTY